MRLIYSEKITSQSGLNVQILEEQKIMRVPFGIGSFYRKPLSYQKHEKC